MHEENPKLSELRTELGATAAAAFEELLTQEEVGARLKVGVRTVERWQQEGVLPFVRLGSTVRFHWPSVVHHVITNFTVCRCGRWEARSAGCGAGSPAARGRRTEVGGQKSNPARIAP